MSQLNESQLTQFKEQLIASLDNTRSMINAIFQASDRASHHLAVKNLGNLSADALIEFTSKIGDPELSRKIDKLKKIDASLISIEMGMYGLCSDCESELTVQRLSADPTVQRCPGCEAKYQKQKCNNYRL